MVSAFTIGQLVNELKVTARQVKFKGRDPFVIFDFGGFTPKSFDYDRTGLKLKYDRSESQTLDLFGAAARKVIGTEVSGNTVRDTEVIWIGDNTVISGIQTTSNKVILMTAYAEKAWI